MSAYNFLKKQLLQFLPPSLLENPTILFSVVWEIYHAVTPKMTKHLLCLDGFQALDRKWVSILLLATEYLCFLVLGQLQACSCKEC